MQHIFPDKIQTAISGTRPEMAELRFISGTQQLIEQVKPLSD